MVNPNSRLVNRRRAISWIVWTIGGAIGAAVATVVGGAALSLGLARRKEQWVDAVALDALTADKPVEVGVRVTRQDGYRQVTERRVVYVVKDKERVRALSATCTHLGCRVSWNEADHAFRCPCHGGRFTADGTVAGGPPPRGLDEVNVRVDTGRVWVSVDA